MRLILACLLTFALGCERDSNKADETAQENASQDQAITPEANAEPDVPVADNNETPNPDPIEDGDENADGQPIGLTLDASSASEPVYIKFENGAPSKTASDQAWLFAMKRTQFQTNSGTSGTLNVGVRNLETTDYASVTQCQPGTLTYDEMLPASGAPGSQPYSGNALLNSWYNYDPSTHVVTSKQLVYLITDGTACIKFQILSYNSGVYQILADKLEIPLAPAPEVHEQTIDASSSTATVYLKLEQGQLIPTTADQAWLFAVKRTQFQTNSGTSGTLGVGVHNSGSTDFSAVSSCEGLAYAYDEMLPASGAPGSQPYSGNAVLNAWYNYDMTTHVISSKQLLYLLSDGTTCLKVQILNYASGIYSVKISQL